MNYLSCNLMNVICSLSSAVWIFFLITKYKLELSHSVRCTKFTITAILQLTLSGNDFLADLDALLRSITFAFLLRALLVGGMMCKGEITCFSLPFFNTRVIIIIGECSVANEALQVSRVVHYNSRWYENLDNRKCLQGTRIVKITSDQGL